jgi:hypothetical protein
MSERVRLRTTIVLEYDADPKDYGTDDPEQMVRLDQENWDDDPISLFEFFVNAGDVSIKVEDA